MLKVRLMELAKTRPVQEADCLRLRQELTAYVAKSKDVTKLA